MMRSGSKCVDGRAGLCVGGRGCRGREWQGRRERAEVVDVVKGQWWADVVASYVAASRACTHKGDARRCSMRCQGRIQASTLVGECSTNTQTPATPPNASNACVTGDKQTNNPIPAGSKSRRRCSRLVDRRLAACVLPFTNPATNSCLSLL